jgi:hypothetical protein
MAVPKQRGMPFGLGFRPISPEASKLASATWDYRPPYLPPGLRIGVATNSDEPMEPMLLRQALTQRPDGCPAAIRQPLEHAAGLGEITRVELASPDAVKSSPELQAVLDARRLSVRVETEYHVELGFAGEPRGQKADYQLARPLVFCWRFRLKGRP